MIKFQKTTGKSAEQLEESEHKDVLFDTNWSMFVFRHLSKLIHLVLSACGLCLELS